MKHRRLLLLIVALNLCIIVMGIVTFAWFVEVKRTGTIVFRAGEIDYRIEENDLDNAFIDNSFVIVPGQELVTETGLSIVNHSTISSQVRLRIVVRYTLYDFINHTTEEVSCEFTDANNLEVIGFMNETFEEETKKTGWTYIVDNDVGHWYYQEFTDNIGHNKILLTPDRNIGERIKILDSLKLNGNLLGSYVATQNVVITIYFQGKQANYVEWEDLGFLAIET